MPVLRSISLCHLFKALQELCGYTPDECVAVVTGLIPYWLHNDHTYDITAEYIRSEMDLDTLTAESLLLQLGRPLTEIGETLRGLVNCGAIHRWEVRDFVIMLEMDDGY